MSLTFAISRTRFYQFWLRLWYVSARTPRFQPLLRAEFANLCPFAQADFLYRAGYYNAAVCMSRFGVEKALLRLALITPNWRDHRAKTLNGRIQFLYHAGAIGTETRRQIERFSKRASKAVHETLIESRQAANVLAEGEALRPLIDAAFSRVLNN